MSWVHWVRPRMAAVVVFNHKNAASMPYILYGCNKAHAQCLQQFTQSLRLRYLISCGLYIMQLRVPMVQSL